MPLRYRNPDENTRNLERAFLQGDISAREPLVSALAREGNWRRIFEIIPKINPVIFKWQDQARTLSEPSFPCGCDAPISGREIEVPQGYGLLAQCPCGNYYAFLMNANAMIEAYESGIDEQYSFKTHFDPSKGYFASPTANKLPYSPSAMMVGPLFNEIPPKVLPNGWIEIQLWFSGEQIPTVAILTGTFNELGYAPAIVHLDPDKIDWWVNTRGITTV